MHLLLLPGLFLQATIHLPFYLKRLIPFLLDATLDATPNPVVCGLTSLGQLKCSCVSTCLMTLPHRANTRARDPLCFVYWECPVDRYSRHAPLACKVVLWCLEVLEEHLS